MDLAGASITSTPRTAQAYTEHMFDVKSGLKLPVRTQVIGDQNGYAFSDAAAALRLCAGDSGSVAARASAGHHGDGLAHHGGILVFLPGRKLRGGLARDDR